MIRLLVLIAIVAMISAAVPAMAQTGAYSAGTRSFVVIPMYHMSPALIAQIMGGEVIYDMGPGGGGGRNMGGYGGIGPGMYGGYGYGAGYGGYNQGQNTGFGTPPGRRNNNW